MVEQEDAIEQPEPSSPFDFSSEPELDEESDESSAPIDGLLDKRTTKDGEVEDEVQWAGPYNPKTTWEPASHVQAVSIAEFEVKNNAGKTKKGRGRPPKKKQTKTSTANAPRTRSAGKVAKKSAK